MTGQAFPEFQNGTDVRALSFSELPNGLSLDSYQRPYVWDAEKAEQLVEDLLAHKQQHGNDKPYYMGTLLLHQPKDRQGEGDGVLYVIDGQQRLTTLALLHHAVNGDFPDKIAFEFRSPVSHRNIKAVRQALTKKRLSAETLGPLLDDLVFTVIAVDQEDLAFTFFDTQNSRGVPLATTDLLKSFHLRSIKGESEQANQEERIQALSARRWEELQIADESAAEGKYRDFAPELFHYYLWRARNWRGQQTIVREDRDQLLDSFQKRVVPGAGLDTVPLYPTPANQLARRLRLDGSGNIQLEGGNIALADRPADLPFSLRQPIHAGVGFFLFAARYAALTRRLFKDKPASEELEKYRAFYEEAAAWNSPYLRQLHRLAVLMYYDQFGEDRLLRFAWALEYVLGAIRMTKKRVFQRSAMKYLEETRLNLLDVIATAYRPEEVLEFLLRPEHHVGHNKRLDEAFNDGRPKGSGVQGRYHDRLSAYFGKMFESSDLEWSRFRPAMEASL